MLRHFVRTGPALAFLNITGQFSFDKPSGTTETEKKADKSVIQTETGWDRVKRLFEIDEFGYMSHEAATVLQVAAMSSFVGMLYGGVMYSKVAYIEFIKNNQATSFNDHIHAKKKLQEKVMLSFARGAWKWGWRLTLFCTSFTALSTVISEYRGKFGVLDYVAAGSVSGFLYKFKEGPRAWVVGSGLGAVLGLFGGSITVGLLHLTGTSIEDVRYWQHHWMKYRDDYMKKGMEEYLKKEEVDFVVQHNERLGEEGKDIKNLDKIANNKTPQKYRVFF